MKFSHCKFNLIVLFSFTWIQTPAADDAFTAPIYLLSAAVGHHNFDHGVLMHTLADIWYLLLCLAGDVQVLHVTQNSCRLNILKNLTNRRFRFELRIRFQYQSNYSQYIHWIVKCDQNKPNILIIFI